MSAFMVPDEHLSLLVQAATQYRPGHHGVFSYYYFPSGRAEGRNYFHFEVRAYDDSADETVAMLWQENVNSLCHRYPGDEPGFMVTAEVAPKYKAPHYGHVQPLVILKALSCYEYQACEHPGWENSRARDFCRALQETAIHDLPGYEDAAGWPYTAAQQQRKAS